jgi:XTP/dITP diphosphohydrolase
VGATRASTAGLVLATDNPGKLGELRTLLAPLGVHAPSARELGFALPPETGHSYLDNAAIKANAITRALDRAALGDDTGLEVPALGGIPGVDTAGFAAAHGGWAQACAELARISGVRDGHEVRATLCCALVLLERDGTRHDAEARIEGRLCWPPTDAPGLAAIFVPDADAPLVDDGVLLSRRVAFERLRPALLALVHGR